MLALDEFICGQRQVALQDRQGILRRRQGRRQEDGRYRFQAGGQIITAAIEQSTGGKFPTFPQGGGDVPRSSSAGTSIRAEKPIEAVAQWAAGELRPLCVFDSKRIPLTRR